MHIERSRNNIFDYLGGQDASAPMLTIGVMIRMYLPTFREEKSRLAERKRVGQPFPTKEKPDDVENLE